MWILLMEAGLAVGLLLFIVWWTLGPTQRREREAFEAMRAERAVDVERGSLASEDNTRREARDTTPSSTRVDPVDRS